MPVDSDGNHAELVMDPNASINRMNPGRNYEQFFNASSRDTHRRLCREFLGVEPETKEHLAAEVINKLPEEKIQQAWNYLMGFYQIISPIARSWFEDKGVIGTDTSCRDYLAQIVQRGITIYFPTDNPVESEQAVMQLNHHYPSTFGPVTYVGNSGRRITTKANVRIAKVYMIVLEKIGDDGSAVSSAKRSNFGVPAQVTKVDKYSKPARLQAVRGYGEAEVRILISYLGTLFVAEVFDRNNNPRTHKAICYNIFAANEPNNVEMIVNRKEIGYGGAKSLQLVKHYAFCGGWEFVYQKYTQNYPVSDWQIHQTA